MNLLWQCQTMGIIKMRYFIYAGLFLISIIVLYGVDKTINMESLDGVQVEETILDMGEVREKNYEQ